ncbi:hypothetical protein TBR22_A02470 [Luteitalea sp. TBR-22]|nr:hypothetical protein TBR22_A02470 [Luteitalea sp. TBR-22]
MFWLHLCAGVSAGLVVVLMSVTGVLLAYEKQITRWADGYHGAPATPGQPRLPIERIVEKARAAHGAGAPASVTLRNAADAPVEVSFGREGSVFLHAYTGEVLGTGSASARAFFRSTMEWHRWLALKDAGRATGKMVTGVSNLVFLFIVMSGFYLWWPRTWTWTQFRQVLWFRGGLSGKARDFNWHHVIGYWSLVPLAVIVWSGAVIGYPWASDLTFRMAGEAPPQGGPQRPGEGGPPRPGGPDGGERRPGPEGGREQHEAPAMADATPGLTLGALVARAEAHTADWTIISARLPRPSDPVVQVSVDTGTGAQPQKRGTLTLDRATGATKKWEGFEAQSRGRQWRTWMRFVHTGEYYGLIGQTVAMLVSAGAVVLAWTGLALTWRRFTAWRRRSPRVATRAA